MENPFEIILNRLDRIETLIHSFNLTGNTNNVIAHRVLNIKQLSEFIGISQSAIYKKTSERAIPHYKNGKKLYFNYEEIENWLLTTKIASAQEIDEMANIYISKRNLKLK